jgi:hypothetical protein
LKNVIHFKYHKNGIFMRTARLKISAGCILLTLILAGCNTVRPTKVSTDRKDYGEVIAESWKQQTLLNVVRLRYDDAPVFLQITSIINSNSVGGNVNAGAGIGLTPVTGAITLGGEQFWSNTPTISYQPLMGEQFTKSLLEPISPLAVFQLIQTGWPVEMVFRTTVRSINGLQNAFEETAADTAFIELVKNIASIQHAGGLGYRIESHSNAGNNLMVVLPAESEGALLTKERRRVRDLLQLEDLSNEFQVEYGLFPNSHKEVAIVTRSMLDIMMQLGYGIDIPPTHLAEGRVNSGASSNDGRKPKVLSHIHSGPTKPQGTYVSVQYKDYWYWIDDSDVPSKKLFTFLMILFSLAETGQNYTSPVVTVPSR